MTCSKMTSYDETVRNFRLEIPEFYNFGFDVIEKRALENDKTAYIAVDNSGETIVRHSFSDLNNQSNRFANVLLETGIAKGELAFVMIPRVPAWYEVMIGCCKTGVVPMPGTNLLMPKDIKYRIQASEATVAIVTSVSAERVDEIRNECPTLKHLIVIGEERDGWTHYETALANASDTLDKDKIETTRSDDLMLVYFTSGTTGMPKMVQRDHSYALAHSITGCYWMDLGEDDIHWTLSDTGWAKAAWGMLYAPWQMGAAMVLYDGAGVDVDLHLRLIEKLGVTTFCSPPTLYRMFAQQDLSQYNLSSIRYSMGAGEPLNPEIIKVWQAATGGSIHDGYGQTESVCLVANYPCMPVRPGSMGKPLPGLDVQVVDEAGAPVPVGVIGHIAVRITIPHPPGLFREYWKDPDATASAFRNGWYYTGDMATLDEDGYFWFVGRSDDVITSSGYRISPFEVESTLLEHPAVAESAVVGRPDEMRTEIVKAYVVLAKDYEGSDELKEDIQAFVKKNTAPYKYPREIEFRDTLPKTISGKIRRVELRAED
jgi:acetyl-CoA synthetase